MHLKTNKTCSICKVEQSISQFAKNKHAKDGHQRRCRTCSSVENNQRRVRLALIKDQPCLDCKHKFPSVCMQFDHRNKTTKLGHISRMVSCGYKWEKIEAEIAKCDLVCANCHAIRTWFKG